MGILTRKAKVVLNYLEDKPVVFKQQQINLPAIPFIALVEECAVSCGVNTNQTKSVIDALVNRIVMFMNQGHSVKMGEFGTFKPEIRVKTAKKLDEATIETIQKKVIRFYPGKAFREMLDGLDVREGSAALDDEE